MTKRELLTDVAARALVIALFIRLSINLLADFLRTGHVTGLLLLGSESLIIVLMIIRRRAKLIDRSVMSAAVTMISIVGPYLVRTDAVPGLVPDGLTAAISGLGLSLEILGKITIGRSFGIVPANRGVVVSGPYSLVRHPIYSGYLVTHVAFLVAHPTPRNLVVLLVADSALIFRALLEERVLSHDVDYRRYCQRVEWHLVPGVF